jgi:signal transduction histidine kinase/ligand-binding sensor domain-containing protein
MNARTHAKSYLYDGKQGLSHNIIQSLVKDKQGKLWVGTQKGLNTFDGYLFTPIAGLEDCIIYDLLYDSLLNYIWVASSKGLFRIDIYSGSIIDCTLKIRNPDVRNLTQYNGNLYAVFLDGRVLGISPEYHSWFVQNTVYDAFGKTQKLFAVFDGEGYVYFNIAYDFNMFAIHLVTGNKVAIPKVDLTGALTGQGSCIINSGGKKIFFINTKSKDLKSVEYQLPTSKYGRGISTICQDGDLCYIGFGEGCSIYKRDTVNHTLVLVKENENEQYYRSRSINVIYPDGTNVLWIGTNKGLIKQVTVQRQPFYRKLKYPLGSQLSIRTIVNAAPSKLYFVGYYGLYSYDMLTDTTTLFNQSWFRSGVYISPYIYAGRETNKDFFYRLNVNTGETDSAFCQIGKSAKQIRTVWSILHGKNDVLWMGTDKGLASYNMASNRLVLHDSDSFSMGDKDIYFISPNSDSTQLVAVGKGGFYLIDLALKTVKNLNHKNCPELPDDEFIFCGTHPDGSYWLGTKSSGVVSISKDLKQVKVYDHKYGLSNNEVYAVLWADSIEAWVTTAAGLNRFDLKQQTFDIYYYEDGIADDEFNQNSFSLHGGKIYAGGIDGVTIFSPNEIIHRSKQVTIFCTSVSKWSNNTFRSTVANYTVPIEMEPQYQLLKFTFGLSDYSTTENNAYFYQIKGINKEWVPLGNSNTLSLEGLSPGNYEVAIIGYNKLGNKSINTLEFKIKVTQVYYRTVWFYGIILSVLSLLIIVYYRWRLKQIDMRYQLRTKISSNLHDEVGSLLTSIIVSTDSVRFSSTNAVDRDKKLGHISDLSREAVNTMSDVLWSIDARNDKAGSFTDRMQEHALGMFGDTSIDVRFDITETDQDQFMEPDTRQQLYLIFKEALNNVLKHSNATYVKIKYAQKGKRFELTIENDRNDVNKSLNTPLGQGLRNMEMRAGRIGASFSIEDTKGERFCIHVIGEN